MIDFVKREVVRGRVELMSEETNTWKGKIIVYCFRITDNATDIMCKLATQPGPCRFQLGVSFISVGKGETWEAENKLSFTSFLYLF